MIERTFYQENFEPKIDNINKEFAKKWQEDSWCKKNKILEEQYYQYESKIKKFRFLNLFAFVVLPLSFIFFIFPFFFAYKKYKKDRSEQKQLQKGKDQIANQLKEIRKEIVQSFLFDQNFEAIYSLLKVKNIGPITSDLIKLLQALSLFNLDYQNDNINPWNSLWGISENNKLFFSVATQEHKVIMKTYSNSIMVKKGDSYITITAYYDHPFPIVTINQHKFLFMSSCSNLEFDFKKSHLGSLIKKSNKYNGLENKEFEKNFDWTRNDEVEFRMIFTPLMQEMYLKEIKAQDKQVLNEDQYFKVKSFLSNKYFVNDENNLYWDTRQIFYYFLENPQIRFDDLLDEYQRVIKDVVFDEYRSFKYLYNIPFIQSINDKVMIKKALSLTKKYEPIYIFYIISQIIRKQIYVIDVNPFYKLLSFNDNQQVCEADVEILTYKRVEKTTFVFTQGRSIPVTYDDFLPRTKNIKIYYSFINNIEVFYRPIEIGQYVEEPKLIDEKLLKMIQDFDSQNNTETYIKDGIVTCIILNEQQASQNITNYIQNILNIIKND